MEESYLQVTAKETELWGADLGCPSLGYSAVPGPLFLPGVKELSIVWLVGQVLDLEVGRKGGDWLERSGGWGAVLVNGQQCDPLHCPPLQSLLPCH